MSNEHKTKNISTISDVRRRDYKCQWDPTIEKEIQGYIRSALSKSGVNTYDYVSDCLQAFYDRSVSNVAQRTKNESGFIFEHFCLLYLKAKGYGECWLLADAPAEVLEKLKMSRVDLGIDIIIKHANGYFAVQAKWRSNKNKKAKISLTWNKLSTFYALCARTGPWLKCIVMTNCDYVRRQGNKLKIDHTIAKGRIRAASRARWIAMAGLQEGGRSLLSATISEDDAPALLRLVAQSTGRDPSYYDGWEMDTLIQRLEASRLTSGLNTNLVAEESMSAYDIAPPGGLVIPSMRKLKKERDPEDPPAVPESKPPRSGSSAIAIRRAAFLDRVYPK